MSSLLLEQFPAEYGILDREFLLSLVLRDMGESWISTYLDFPILRWLYPVNMPEVDEAGRWLTLPVLKIMIPRERLLMVHFVGL